MDSWDLFLSSCTLDVMVMATTGSGQRQQSEVVRAVGSPDPFRMLSYA